MTTSRGAENGVKFEAQPRHGTGYTGRVVSRCGRAREVFRIGGGEGEEVGRTRSGVVGGLGETRLYSGGDTNAVVRAASAARRRSSKTLG